MGTDCGLGGPGVSGDEIASSFLSSQRRGVKAFETASGAGPRERAFAPLKADTRRDGLIVVVLEHPSAYQRDSRSTRNQAWIVV